MTGDDQPLPRTGRNGSVAALFEAAVAARRNAYAPYSNFAVGASVRSMEGGVFAGANVENAAYPVGTCAEAGAIAAMVAAGHRRIAEVLVVGEGAGLVTPCGACRQRLSEFGTTDTPVHVAGLDGLRARFSLGELLPASFSFPQRHQHDAASGKDSGSVSHNITGAE